VKGTRGRERDVEAAAGRRGGADSIVEGDRPGKVMSPRANRAAAYQLIIELGLSEWPVLLFRSR